MSENKGDVPFSVEYEKIDNSWAFQKMGLRRSNRFEKRVKSRTKINKYTPYVLD